MRVVRVWTFGGPEELVIGEAPDAVAGPGEVVVDVEVAGMTFVETQIRRGTDPWHVRPDLPYVPGGLVAGTVAALGVGTDPAWLAKRVVADIGENGGFAEFATASTAALVEVPEQLGFPEAVALFSDGSTARGLIECARLHADEWVLVEAAAGGVGSLLVQLARAAGARVIGAARGEAKLEVVRNLGADVVVDYTQPDWASRVVEATGGAGVDLAFDGVGGQIGLAAFEATADGGRFSVHGASSGHATVIDPAAASARGIEVLGIEQLFEFKQHQRRWAADVMDMAISGGIQPIIGQTFPLEHAAQAHATVENRTAIGKTLILV